MKFSKVVLVIALHSAPIWAQDFSYLRQCFFSFFAGEAVEREIAMETPESIPSTGINRHSRTTIFFHLVSNQKMLPVEARLLNNYQFESGPLEIQVQINIAEPAFAHNLLNDLSRNNIEIVNQRFVEQSLSVTSRITSEVALEHFLDSLRSIDASSQETIEHISVLISKEKITNMLDRLEQSNIIAKETRDQIENYESHPTALEVTFIIPRIGAIRAIEQMLNMRFHVRTEDERHVLKTTIHNLSQRNWLIQKITDNLPSL